MCLLLSEKISLRKTDASALKVQEYENLSMNKWYRQNIGTLFQLLPEFCLPEKFICGLLLVESKYSIQHYHYSHIFNCLWYIKKVNFDWILMRNYSLCFYEHSIWRIQFIYLSATSFIQQNAQGYLKRTSKISAFSYEARSIRMPFSSSPLCQRLYSLFSSL